MSREGMVWVAGGGVGGCERGGLGGMGGSFELG